MFDVWNSTCRLDNLQLFANTPDTAVSLIHSSTFVRLIGVSVSESTNHLCGTSGMPLDWTGSSLLSNCSFSSSITNDTPSPITEPTPEPGKEIDEYTSQTTRISLTQYLSDETVHNPVWITSCTFNGLAAPGSESGAAIHLDQYRADVVIKASSFERCHATYETAHGAVFLCHYSSSTAANVYSATLTASDELKTDISVGSVSFASSNTETIKPLAVVISPSGKLLYGKTYKVKTLSSPALIVKHSSPTIDVPPNPRVDVLHISSAGSDENEGTENDPLLTLHTALGKCKTELIDVWLLEIADWCRIGKQTKLGLEQEGLSVVVKGGEGRKLECTLTDSAQTSEQRDSKEQGMVSVSKNTLSFIDVMFVVTPSSDRIGSVFGGKGSVISVSEKGRLTLSSCSFDGVSFESGGVVVGKTRGKIEIDSTEFRRCSGRSLGSMFRLVTVGGEVIVSNCEFDSCSTTIALDEQGRRELGGGSVLVEMEEKGRSVSSCRVDLRESRFLECSLSWVGKREGVEVVGGSGFLIVGRRVKGVVLLDGVRLSSCSCVRDIGSAAFSGGPLSLLASLLSTPNPSLISRSATLHPPFHLACQSNPSPFRLFISASLISPPIVLRFFPSIQSLPLVMFAESTNLLLHPPHSALHPSRHLSSRIVPLSSLPD
ncbi:hypothetical protein BLNAU_19002 [Blattamonas nauphoetae]|uniref:Right handed beta helix domain-containing protein n=1 Tax=Blattamonas nauphoetae TaxID=2049346 RepID=A0ABQ9X2V4_9EUKA|nr:hypothetical protein BLNAU_19002 [Blattamonas nauphoetae]